MARGDFAPAPGNAGSKFFGATGLGWTVAWPTYAVTPHLGLGRVEGAGEGAWGPAFGVVFARAWADGMVPYLLGDVVWATEGSSRIVTDPWVKGSWPAVDLTAGLSRQVAAGRIHFEASLRLPPDTRTFQSWPTAEGAGLAQVWVGAGFAPGDPRGPAPFLGPVGKGRRP